jgi:23S rRNA (adenine2503-C2)-methyltransferase
MNGDLKDKTLVEIEQIASAMGQKRYAAGYIFSFVHSKGCEDVSQISPLSKAFRSDLAGQGYFISRLDIVKKLTDADGTVKYTFGLADGGRIESVLLFDGRRKTLCVSTQAGCAMDCAFCATAKVKLRRNLTAGEIVDQVYAVQRDRHRVSNVVYMGMGEPLQNYEAVLKSVRILNHPAGANIGIRHLTISTCGIAPAIKMLADEDLHPRLAISLNAPTDNLRTRLMPVNKRYPIADVLAAVKAYQLKVKDRVTFEYVMIKGHNDDAAHARLLAKLLSKFKCNVNLIEYNPHRGCEFTGSSTEKLERFAEILEESGIETTIRFRMGRGISAACGQLGADWAESQTKGDEKV